jgi:hypothetical protein
MFTRIKRLNRRKPGRNRRGIKDAESWYFYSGHNNTCPYVWKEKSSSHFFAFFLFPALFVVLSGDFTWSGDWIFSIRPG